MPFGDGTGPRGEGPRTGRGAGYCSGYNQPGYANPFPRGGFGRGFGRGFGPGRGPGFRRNYGYRYYRTGYPTWNRGQNNIGSIAQSEQNEFDREPEVQSLRDEQRVIEEEITDLKDRLDQIKQRINKLENNE